MPEVKYGYVAIKVYGHVNCDHKTVCKPQKTRPKTAVMYYSRVPDQLIWEFSIVNIGGKGQELPRGEVLPFSSDRADRQREA
jgi:hypothetical protein